MCFYESWLNLPFGGMKAFSKMHIFKAVKSDQNNQLIFEGCENRLQTSINQLVLAIQS